MLRLISLCERRYLATLNYKDFKATTKGVELSESKILIGNPPPGVH